QSRFPVARLHPPSPAHTEPKADRTSSRQITETPAAFTRPISSLASSIERPVPSYFAEAAFMPVASSSVIDALKIFCTLPKCSASRRALGGPSPGVKVSASQCKTRLSPALEAAATAGGTKHLSSTNSRTLYISKKRCQGHPIHSSVKINH